jgi:hypothetical protein
MARSAAVRFKSELCAVESDCLTCTAVSRHRVADQKFLNHETPAVERLRKTRRTSSGLPAGSVPVL